MKAYFSQYTAISEFNLSDSVLLVSGQRREFPHFNLLGYIAFFGLGGKSSCLKMLMLLVVVVVVVLLFYVHGKHLRSCRDGQLTKPHFSWAGVDLLSG